MQTSDGIFQLRPHKDFGPARGRDRLLSLRILAELPISDDYGQTNDHSLSDHPEPPKNASDFMRQRREVNGDPSLKKWNAMIRLGNFATLDNAPLCVRVDKQIFVFSLSSGV